MSTEKNEKDTKLEVIISRYRVSFTVETNSVSSTAEVVQWLYAKLGEDTKYSQIHNLNVVQIYQGSRPHVGRPPVDLDVTKVIQMRKNGCTFKQIANALGKNIATVQKRLKSWEMENGAIVLDP